MLIIFGIVTHFKETKETIPLRSLAEKQELFIGSAVNSKNLIGGTQYEKILSTEFNMVTTENDMKFSLIHPEKNTYDFSKADQIVDFAMENNQKVRGHTLVWHNQIPDWIKYGNFSEYQMRKILKDHIQTVVSRYRGKVFAWDVVNEALNEDGSLRDSIWLRTIGEDYIALAFQWAHEADPDALLFYNDYGIEGINAKSNSLYSMLKKLKNKGVPIDGVGYQMHTRISRNINPETLKKSMDRLQNIGLQTHITELDIGIATSGSLNTRLNKQAKMYSNILKVCLDTESCTALVMWGFTDKYTWKDKEARPLIFDANYNPKKAYWSITETLKENQK